MAVTIKSEQGKEFSGSFEYYCDDATDIPSLPTDALAGSSAIIIDTGDILMLNSKGEWKKW
ncbi:hypothetical protein LJC04_05440 [Ruminococcaceae bacterium OttesenSCG-928-O06]|nr:hypothetical protein [Ruminococcaceae bacterium OttesenSCG-928-O06]